MKAWRITWESMDGVKWTTEIWADTRLEAADALCRDRRVGNILAIVRVKAAK